MISRKKVVSAVVALSLYAVACGVAMAYGGGPRGGRGGDRNLFVLARATGLTHTQIKSAFATNRTTLKADHAALESARTNLDTCLVAGTDCTSQASAYLTAKQTAAKDKLSVWQGLFKGNPNPQKGAAVLQQLEQLQASRKQIFQQVRGADSTGADSATE